MGKIDSRALFWLLVGLTAGACQHVGLADAVGDGGPNGDSDTDSDSDGDTDADSDDTEAALCGEILCAAASVHGDDGGDLAGCTHVAGDVTIINATVGALEAAEELRCVDGDLTFYQNDDIENLDAFSNLVRVGGSLRIGALATNGNPSLTSVAGLAGVASTVEDITVMENPSLESLDGLYNVGGITGRLDIRYNDALAEISGLGWIPHHGDVIMIMYNDCLPAEEAEGVTNAMIAGGFSGDVYVHDNGPGCL